MPSNAARTRAPKLDLESFLPYRLSVLSNRVSGAIARQYSDRFGLSVPEWRVMAVLGGAPGLTAREVAERTEMDKVQVSRAVQSLVKSRRVQREQHPHDGRSAHLSLTAKGQAIYDEITPLALHLEDLLISALNPQERAALDKLMAKLARQSKLLRA